MFLKTKLSPNAEEATARLEIGDYATKTAPPENTEQLSQLGVALMGEIAPQMQNQIVNMEFHFQHLRPFLQVIIASQLKIVPGKKNG